MEGIPENAIGRPGMVAMLRRVAPENLDKLVAVRFPVGRVSTPVGSSRAVLAWQVLVLGEPMTIRGEPCRDVVIADRCLIPVAQIGAEEVEALVKVAARAEFDSALADLSKTLAACPMGPAEFEHELRAAGEEAALARALEEVPAVQALVELGFRQDPSSEGSYEWLVTQVGLALRFIVQPDMFGSRWQVVAMGNGSRVAIWDESFLLESCPRGMAHEVILSMCERAFGPDVAPPGLDLGRLFRAHRRDMRSLEVGLPTVTLDGQVLRAIRRWLAERFPLNEQTALPGDDVLNLRVMDDMLRFETGGAAYACPSRGWIDPVSISLREFLALPPWALRGRRVIAIFSLDCAVLGHHPVRVIE